MTRQRWVNIIAIVIAVAAAIVIWYAYAHGLNTGYYAVPFWLALSILGLWNWRKWKVEKEAQEAANHHD